jgi:hypothetical protein
LPLDLRTPLPELRQQVLQAGVVINVNWLYTVLLGAFLG